MARIYKTGDPHGRWESDREPSEHIKEDSPPGRGYGRSVELRGDEIGKTGEELLAYAKEQLAKYEYKVDILLRHVPRKYEEKIKKLAVPLQKTRRAIDAVSILIANNRTVDQIPED